MARTYTERKRIRKSFARIPEIAPLPNLIELQKTSYENFLQMDVSAEKEHQLDCKKFFSPFYRSVIFRVNHSQNFIAMILILQSMMWMNVSREE